MNHAWILAVSVALTASLPTLADGTARGVVYDDRNGNQRRDDGEPGIADVAVSNGREVVATSPDGRYELPVEDDTIVFLHKPRGWMTPVDHNGLPKFFYLHKPAGSPPLKYEGVAPTGALPDSLDFPLRRQDEPDAFNVVAFGDPQPYSIEEVQYYAHDIVEEVIGVDAKFGLSLGDLVGDDLTLMAPLNEVTGRIGLPWYHILGNHDMNYDAADDRHSDETFERVYGPPYYAFDYGQTHFVVLDDVNWIGPRGNEKGRYEGRFGEKQLEWLRNDLARVPADRLVVCTFHIPLADVKDKQPFLDALAGHPKQLSLAAHWHMQTHYHEGADTESAGPAARPRAEGAHTTDGQALETNGHAHASPSRGHHHFIVGTASGSWWRGMPDEYGIPHTQMRDGAPNGWLLISFDGADYKWRYKAARRPWSHQMSIFAPETAPARASHEVEVVVNVFCGSERARVEMRVDTGGWRPMSPERRPDPYYVATRAREEKAEQVKLEGLRVSPKPAESPHLWVGRLGESLTPGGHVIEIRATDMFNQVFEDRRIIRITSE